MFNTRLADADAPLELARLLAQHPVNAVIQAAHSGTVSDEATWTQLGEVNPEVQQWIATIQSSEDVNSVLRLALCELFERRIEDHLSYSDIRKDELPESLPVVNLRTMTGGE